MDSVTIQVYPQVGVNAGPDQSILFDHSTTITATSSDPLATYLWLPSIGLEDSTSATTVANPEQTTTYLVYATNSNGCVDVDTLLITVIPKILVPSGITPNGDGVNDVWMIDMIGYYPNCEVEIYNRWGEKLFYSQGYPDSDRWDGTFKGKPLPTGTYYFIINLHDEVANTPPITGPITIMR
jgi:gliding motility-associated-like protein